MIEHDDGLRGETVTADTRGAGAATLRRIEAQVVKTVTPPPGTGLEFTSPEQQFDPSRSLLVNAALAGGGVVVLLLLAFGTARAGGIVLGSTLFALVGGVAAIVLMGGVLSLGALMGFFALFGLSARNAALLITRVDELLSSESAPWSAETVRRAAHDRFSPMAISAVMVCAALLPIAVRSDRPGHEILGPHGVGDPGRGDQLRPVRIGLVADDAGPVLAAPKRRRRTCRSAIIAQRVAMSVRFHQPPPSAWNSATVSA